MSQIAQPTVQHLDPSALLVDVNIREAARLTPDFVESIRDNGVLVPIVAVASQEGVRVRMGQRRTLAAVQAGLSSVPVLVHPSSDISTDEAQVERITTQWAENEHRAGLTRSEQVRAVQQLAAFGLSAAQITKRTKTERVSVDAALVVAGSDLALAAADRYDFLDLTQAAVLAEFQDDPETVKSLVVAAQRGQFDHVAQRARDDRRDRAERDAYAATLTEQGLTVIEPPAYDSPVIRLSSLTDDPGTRAPLTAETHATCPGHAVYVGTEWVWTEVASDDQDTDAEDQDEDHDQGDDDEDDYEDEATPVRTQERVLAAVAVCTAATEHGHHPRFPSGGSSRTPVADMSDVQREAARAERRDVVESNKAWRSAEVVRQEFLSALAQRKTAPKGTAQFLATSLARHGGLVAEVKGNHLAAGLLGATTPAYGRCDDLATLTERATEARCLVIALVQVLAAYEASTHIGSWRNVSPATAAYLGFLATNGYTLADVEKRAAGIEVTPEQD